MEGGEIRCEYGERGRDDKVVVAASRLQTEPASRARLEDELSKLPAQQIAAGRTLSDGENSTPHGGAEPLDQPRFPDDQAIAACAERESGRSPRRGRRRHAAVFSAAARQRRRRGHSDRRRGGRAPARCGAIRANCWRNGACGSRSAAVTVSRPRTPSRSTSALWSRRRARSRPATSLRSEVGTSHLVRGGPKTDFARLAGTEPQSAPRSSKVFYFWRSDERASQPVAGASGRGALVGISNGRLSR